MLDISKEVSTRPSAIRMRHSKEASESLSSEAKRYIRVESVSKLKGRNIRVAGNSLVMSMNTKRNPVINEPLRSGKCMLLRILVVVAPSVLAAKSNLVSSCAMPPSIEL